MAGGWPVMLLDLDAWACAHIAAALRAHRDAMRRNYQSVPDLLEELERSCAARVSAGQRGADLVEQTARLHDEAMTALLMNLDDVGHVLGGVSRSTVNRLIRDGELPGLKVGGRTFVARADLEAYVDTLRETTRSR